MLMLVLHYTDCVEAAHPWLIPEFWGVLTVKPAEVRFGMWVLSAKQLAVRTPQRHVVGVRSCVSRAECAFLLSSPQLVRL